MSDQSAIFTSDQMHLIDNLKEILKELKAQDVHISAVADYEVNIFLDADGKPYVSIS
ncbi:hypothetical protein [Filimonas effusa]|uniref:hypothetical protein n=1 Tax=Filimonas effusa TaxID=2508721 RepID=UPI0013E90F89|nr:hypothetical protein [Filimonas effusa]